MRRHNQRLYRVTRAIVGDDREAEDVTQDAYVRAFEHLDQFAGRARFSTWLTRIAVHEASARLRRRSRLIDIGESMPTLASAAAGPEQPPKSSCLARQARARTARSAVSISSGEVSRLGASRAYLVAYGVTLAMIRRSCRRVTTSSGVVPSTSKQTIPAERLSAGGV